MEAPGNPGPANRPPTRRPWGRYLALALLALVLATGLALAVAGPELLRPVLTRQLSARLDRPVRIDGPLDLHLWSLTPSLAAQDVHLGNPPWSEIPDLFWARRVLVSVDLRRLLRGQWVLSRVELEAPRVHLQEGPGGEPNWALGRQESGGGSPLAVGELKIIDGQVTADLPSRQAAFAISLATDTADPAHAATPLAFDARGRWKGSPLQVRGRAGSLLALEDLSRPYPMAVQGLAGTTRFELDGTVTNFLALAGLEVRFVLAGRSLAELYRLVGVPMPPTPPYRLTARLQHEDSEWRFTELDGRVGRSDLSGTLTVDRKPQPQRISGELKSRRVDLADLSGLIGARAESGQPVAPRPGRVLPDQAFNLEKIAAANVDVHYAGAQILTEQGLFQGLQTHLVIDAGQISLEPLNFGIAQGQVRSRLHLDTRPAPMAARLDLEAARLRLRELLPGEDSKRLTTGALGGRAKLAMRGNSVASLLGSADGELSFAMSGGSTDRLLVRLANLDVANALQAWLRGRPKEEIRCVVGDFQARKGVLETRNLVMDSEKVQIRGEGRISLRDESFDLRLRTAAKDISPLALRGPLRLEGSFAAPRVVPEALPVGGRLATAVALGLVAPPLALLPLVELGDAPEEGCPASFKPAKAAS
jgi:uncharacterized protein involved in outer membrane biogenesis